MVLPWPLALSADVADLNSHATCYVRSSPDAPSSAFWGEGACNVLCLACRPFSCPLCVSVSVSLPLLPALPFTSQSGCNAFSHLSPCDVREESTEFRASASVVSLAHRHTWASNGCDGDTRQNVGPEDSESRRRKTPTQLPTRGGHSTCNFTFAVPGGAMAIALDTLRKSLRASIQPSWPKVGFAISKKVYP